LAGLVFTQLVAVAEAFKYPAAQVVHAVSEVQTLQPVGQALQVLVASTK
jgi:hypothetical protein